MIARNFLAMRGDNIGNLGAHSGNYSMVQKGVEIMSSIYRVPAAHFRARCVLSNTAPTRPYRSAGRDVAIVAQHARCGDGERGAGSARAGHGDGAVRVDELQDAVKRCWAWSSPARL